MKELSTYREHLGELKQRLAADRFLALLLIDVSDINQVERDYGSLIYDSLMSMVRDVVSELKGSSARATSSLSTNRLVMYF